MIPSFFHAYLMLLLVRGGGFCDAKTGGVVEDNGGRKYVKTQKRVRLAQFSRPQSALAKNMPSACFLDVSRPRQREPWWVQPLPAA